MRATVRCIEWHALMRAGFLKCVNCELAIGGFLDITTTTNCDDALAALTHSRRLTRCGCGRDAMTTETVEIQRPQKRELRQWSFAIEYIKDFHGTNAAIRAGYAEKAAHVMASQLLKKTKIQNWIAYHQSLAEKRNEVTIDRVINEYRKIAFADTTRFVSIKGGYVLVRDTDELTPDERAAIAEIKQTKDGIAVKFYSKQPALDSLAKHLGAFSDRNTGQHTLVAAPVINILTATKVDVEVKKDDDD